MELCDVPTHATNESDNPKINREQPYEKGKYVKFRIVCSKGTYIRSIARDFGKKLNSGGHLSQLQRV